MGGCVREIEIANFTETYFEYGSPLSVEKQLCSWFVSKLPRCTDT